MSPKTDNLNSRSRYLILTISKLLESQRLLSPTQFGFRKSRSPWMAINEFLERVHHSWDNQEICLSLFVDICKAFDAVDHNIILEKLGLKSGILHTPTPGVPLHLPWVYPGYPLGIPSSPQLDSPLTPNSISPLAPNPKP